MSTVPNPGPPHSGLPTSETVISGFRPFSGYAVWSWDANVQLWIQVESRPEAGFEAGTGPTGPGRFHGQTVRWACVASST